MGRSLHPSLNTSMDAVKVGPMRTGPTWIDSRAWNPIPWKPPTPEDSVSPSPDKPSRLTAAFAENRRWCSRIEEKPPHLPAVDYRPHEQISVSVVDRFEPRRDFVIVGGPRRYSDGGLDTDRRGLLRIDQYLERQHAVPVPDFERDDVSLAAGCTGGNHHRRVRRQPIARHDPHRQERHLLFTTFDLENSAPGVELRGGFAVVDLGEWDR